MKYPIYSIRDNKVAFNPPQAAENDAQMIRFFAMGINNPKLPENFAPGDFDLYKIGFFDSQKGTVEALEPIELVCSGTSVYGLNSRKESVPLEKS